jgi:predicted dehydrogenase
MHVRQFSIGGELRKPTPGDARMTDRTSAESTPLAIIGCGRISRLHARRIVDDGRARVVALWDPDRAMAEELGRDFFPDAVIFESLSDLFSASGAEGVVICSPTKAHFEQTTAALQAGLHVLCEKPLATSRDEIQSLVELSRSSSRHLMIAYQRRFSPIYRTLRREVRSGRWGKILAVHSHNIENWQSMAAGTWREDPNINPGGFIGDAGSHKIDIVFFVTGLHPLEVYARTDHCGSRVEVTASVSAMLSENVPLTIDFLGHANHFNELLHICCEQADLVVCGPQLFIGRDERMEPVACLETESNPVTGFLDLLRDGAENVVPPECALPVYDLTQGILISGQSGRIEVLPR